MIDRRDFIRTLATVSVGGFVTGSSVSGAAEQSTTRLSSVGLSLFTIPKLLEKDFAGTLQTTAAIGYKEIEFFGPYPFSAPSAHARWQAVSAMLGLKQSGFYGLKVQDVQQVLKRNGLVSPSMHIDLNTLRTRMSETAEAAHLLGQRYVIIPSIPAEERRTLDGYKRVADDFNRIGTQAKKAGLRFVYHNHGYGLTEMEGQIPFKVVLERTDPALVDLQLDIYWTIAGGADPIAYLDAYPGRFRLMHVKDMTRNVRFSGDGGDPKQWTEVFPFMTDAGSGILDLSAILSHARKSGVQHFLVEYDLAPNPDEALKKSYQFLSKLELTAIPSA